MLSNITTNEFGVNFNIGKVSLLDGESVFELDMLRVFKLHQQYKYLLYINRWMYVKTPFNPSNKCPNSAPERFNFPEEEENILKFW